MRINFLIDQLAINMIFVSIFGTFFIIILILFIYFMKKREVGGLFTRFNQTPQLKNNSKVDYFKEVLGDIKMQDKKTIGNFTFIPTSIKDVVIIEPKKYGDERGYFLETYKESDFFEAGLKYKFVQDNQSRSKKGVLRGLHFQKTYPQAKLVRCIEGEVFDVCVDLRKNSPTYGKWEGVVLSAEKGNMFMVPRGFAHGFLVLSETATFCYKCDELYHPEDEGGIMFNDKDVNIDWPEVDGVLLSMKDQKHPSLKEAHIEFDLENN